MAWFVGLLSLVHLSEEVHQNWDMQGWISMDEALKKIDYAYLSVEG